MVICFSCSEETRRALDFLLQHGQYKDHQEAISSAIENQAVLLRNVMERGPLFIQQGSTAPGGPRTREDDTNPSQGAAPPDSHLAEESTLRQINNSGKETHNTIPSLFSLDQLRDLRIPTAPLPADTWLPRQEVPVDRWILGQFNKVLPAKASCRALAHLLSRKPKGVEIQDVALEIAKAAARLGEYLRRIDQVNELGRNEALATAFPTTGTRAEKSLLRYASQFVASVNTQGQVSGLLIELKLINHKNGRSKNLFLTEAGLRFALLPNPILDNRQQKEIQRFSDEEKDFLLTHIANHAPAEDFAYRTILSAIERGCNTPDTLDLELSKLLTDNGRQELSKSFLSSQRSGAISRMVDLGLLERKRNGIRVTYICTEPGKAYKGSES